MVDIENVLDYVIQYRHLREVLLDYLSVVFRGCPPCERIHIWTGGSGKHVLHKIVSIALEDKIAHISYKDLMESDDEACSIINASTVVDFGRHMYTSVIPSTAVVPSADLLIELSSFPGVTIVWDIESLSQTYHENCIIIKKITETRFGDASPSWENDTNEHVKWAQQLSKLLRARMYGVR